jgi:LytS/YehU family sensor histidine kinase
MNYIAMGGSQVGNFSYIDTRENNYEQKVKDSLSESLDIAMEGSNALKLNLTSEEQGIDVSHNLESNFEFSAVEEVDGMPVIENVVLSCQAIVKTEEIEGLQAHICNRESRVQFALSMEKVHDPSDDVMLKAQLKSTNMKIFELIQAVQKPDSDRKAIFEEMSQLDEALNGYIETSMKIKDRELRKELMEQAQNAKLTASKVVGVLRGALNNNLSNATIAELNHCAFAGIRKTG